MSEKKISARIMLKHDIEENWLKATGFIPLRGEVIIYEVDDNHDYERIKIGDGETPVSELPFALDVISTEDIEEILGSLDESDFAGIASPHMMRVTDAEGKAKWENRLAYSVDNLTTLVAETTMSGPSSSTRVTPLFAAEPGMECIVKFDGEIYNLTVEAHDAFGAVLGNQTLIGGEGNSELPFCFITLHPSMMSGVYFKTNAIHTFSIEVNNKTYYPLNYKYLPFAARKGEGTNSVTLNNFFPQGNAGGSYSVAANGGTSHGDFSTAINGGYAEGEYSFANGYHTRAIGISSMASGYYANASSNYQFASGKLNIKDEENKYIHIVGNGNFENDTPQYSNAHTLDWDGNAWYQGEVYVGGTDQTTGSEKLMTASEVTATINAALAAILPTPTADDTGKILRVNAEGKYELVALPNAEEATF